MDESASLWRRPLVFLSRNHLARNSGFTVGTGIANGVLGYAFWAVADRSTTASSVGTAAALLSLMTLAAILSNAGIGPTIVQQLPSLRDPSEWGALVSGAVIASAGAAAVIGIVLAVILPNISSNYVGISQNPILFIGVIIGTIILTCSIMLDYVNIGARQTHIGFIRNSSFGLLKLLLLVGLVAIGVKEAASTVLSVWIWSSAAISILTFVFLLPKSGRKNSWPSGATWTGLRRDFKWIAGNFVTMIGAAILPYLMPLLVVVILSPTQNAYFYMAWTIASLPLIVSAAVPGNLLAEASFHPGQLRRQVWSGIRIECAILLPISLGIAILGIPILSAFGPRYASNSYSILLVFLLVVWPDTLTNTYVTVLRLWGKIDLAAWLNVIISIVALGSSVILMQRFGAIGAAWGWFAGEMFGTLLVGAHLLFRRSKIASV